MPGRHQRTEPRLRATAARRACAKGLRGSCGGPCAVQGGPDGVDPTEGRLRRCFVERRDRFGHASQVGDCCFAQLLPHASIENPDCDVILGRRALFAFGHSRRWSDAAAKHRASRVVLDRAGRALQQDVGLDLAVLRRRRAFDDLARLQALPVAARRHLYPVTPAGLGQPVARQVVASCRARTRSADSASHRVGTRAAASSRWQLPRAPGGRSRESRRALARCR